MKFVRTVRSYQALNAEVDGKTYAVTGHALEVSEKAATELAKIGSENGVELEVLDQAPDDAAAVAAVNSRPVDLSEGRSAISGGGSPVMTTDVAADEAPADAEAATAATTTTTTPATVGTATKEK